MKILAIETSCDILSISLLEDDNLILELTENSPKTFRSINATYRQIVKGNKYHSRKHLIFSLWHRSSAHLQELE